MDAEARTRADLPVAWQIPRPWVQALASIVGFVAAGIGLGFGLEELARVLLPTDRMPIASPVIISASALAAYVGSVRAFELRWPMELRVRRIPELLGGLLLGAMLCFGLVAIMLGADWIEFAGQRDRSALLASILTAGVLAGVAGELFFRGMLYRHLENLAGTWVAVGATTVLFGTMHGLDPAATAWTTLCVAIEGGLFFGLLYSLTRSLWLVIGLHAAWNIVQGPVLGSPVSGFDADAWLISHPIGPTLWSGGDFGIEASLLTVLVFLGLSGLLAAVLVGTRRVVPFGGQVTRSPGSAPANGSSR